MLCYESSIQASSDEAERETWSKALSFRKGLKKAYRNGRKMSDTDASKPKVSKGISVEVPIGVPVEPDVIQELS